MCYLNKDPFPLTLLLLAAHCKGNMHDFTHHIVSGNYEVMNAASFFPLRPMCSRQRSCFHTAHP